MDTATASLLRLRARSGKLVSYREVAYDNQSFTRAPYESATQETVRQLNRRLIFHLIRAEPGVSRVELSKRSGISRSNVSSIVEELAAAGLIDQAKAEPSGRGRVPTKLNIDDRDSAVIAVSIRRWRTSIGIAAASGRILRSVEIPTTADPDALVACIESAAAKLGAPRAWAGRKPVVGVSVPGSVNHSAGRVVRIPGLRRYEGYELAAAVQSALGLTTVADNDCNLGALAELWNNASEVRGLADFVFLEIGQFGVGAGIVLDRKLYRGHDQTLVGELGHMVIDPLGPECACGRRGCWERYICDEATFHRWSDEPGYQPERFHEMVAAAMAGDGAAREAFEETLEHTLLGVSNIQAILNPQAVILAGEITRLWPLFEKGKSAGGIRPATRASHDLFFQGAAVLAVEAAVDDAR